MAYRKPQLEKVIDDLLQLGSDNPSFEQKLRKYAEKYMNNAKQKLTTFILAERDAILSLKESRLNVSPEESIAIDEKINRHNLQKSVWETALQLRHERYYSKPTYPLERNIADHAIFSVSPRKKTTKRKDEELGGFVRDNGRAIIAHAGNKELTIQDAKVLIAIHKLWDECGRQRSLEVPIHQLAKKLNRSWGGKTYDEIWTSLETLFDTKLQFYRYRENGSLKNLKQIHILEMVGTRGEKAEIKFSETIYDSLSSGALIYLSLALLEDLSTNTAQGLYVFFASQVLHGVLNWGIDDLCKMLDIKADRPHKRIDMIRTACEDMQEIGLLEDYSIEHEEGNTATLHISPSHLLMKSTKQNKSMQWQQTHLSLD